MNLMRAAELYENVSFADFQIFHQRQFLQSEEYDNYSFKLLCLIYGFKFRYDPPNICSSRGRGVYIHLHMTQWQPAIKNAAESNIFVSDELIKSFLDVFSNNQNTNLALVFQLKCWSGRNSGKFASIKDSVVDYKNG